jgi:hypothetical protein
MLEPYGQRLYKCMSGPWNRGKKTSYAVNSILYSEEYDILLILIHVNLVHLIISQFLKIHVNVLVCLGIPSMTSCTLATILYAFLDHTATKKTD